MIRFNQKAHKLVDAMNITAEGFKLVQEKWMHIDNQFKDHKKTVGWAMQRINIDEQLNEGQKYYLVFSLGRMYQDHERGLQ